MHLPVWMLSQFSLVYAYIMVLKQDVLFSTRFINYTG